MKVVWDTVLKDMKGEPIIERGKTLLLEHIAYESLILHNPQEMMSAEDKLRQARLADKIVNGKASEIDKEQFDLIKSVIGKYQGPLILLAVEKLLGDWKEDEAK
jgi:hypothetical protein